MNYIVMTFLVSFLVIFWIFYLPQLFSVPFTRPPASLASRLLFASILVLFFVSVPLQIASSSLSPFSLGFFWFL